MALLLSLNDEIPCFFFKWAVNVRFCLNFWWQSWHSCVLPHSLRWVFRYLNSVVEDETKWLKLFKRNNFASNFTNVSNVALGTEVSNVSFEVERSRFDFQNVVKLLSGKIICDGELVRFRQNLIDGHMILEIFMLQVVQVDEQICNWRRRNVKSSSTSQI